MDQQGELLGGDQSIGDLPINPNTVLEKARHDGLIPEKVLNYFSYNEAKQMGIDTGPLGIVVDEFGSVMAAPGVPENVSKSVALAIQMVPERVLSKLGILSTPGFNIPVIIVGGALRLKTGQRLPATVDLNDNVPINIKMSVENIRIAFGLPHNRTNQLDPVTCFATAAHEISDWIQITHTSHDSLFASEDTDEGMRAKKHKASKSEAFSNAIATELTEEIFGVTVTFNENDDRVYTPEPPNY